MGSPRHRLKIFPMKIPFIIRLTDRFVGCCRFKAKVGDLLLPPKNERVDCSQCSVFPWAGHPTCHSDYAGEHKHHNDALIWFDSNNQLHDDANDGVIIATINCNRSPMIIRPIFIIITMMMMMNIIIILQFQWRWWSSSSWLSTLGFLWIVSLAYLFTLLLFVN